jgi:hypothetical protein
VYVCYKERQDNGIMEVRERENNLMSNFQVHVKVSTHESSSLHFHCRYVGFHLVLNNYITLQ